MLCKSLKSAFRPAKPLIPGLLVSNGLLVVKLRGLAISEFYTLSNAVAGKFVVLGESVVGPAAVVHLLDFIREEEARARNLRAGADTETRAV